MPDAGRRVGRYGLPCGGCATHEQANHSRERFGDSKGSAQGVIHADTKLTYKMKRAAITRQILMSD